MNSKEGKESNEMKEVRVRNQQAGLYVYLSKDLRINGVRRVLKGSLVQHPILGSDFLLSSPSTCLLSLCIHLQRREQPSSQCC